MRTALRIDARGLLCPWPALRAARAMREADSIDLLADDPAAAREIAALAAAHGWGFRADLDTFHLFRIKG